MNTHRLVPGLLAGALLVGGTSGVFAAKGHAKKAKSRGAAGLVSNLTSNGFTLTQTNKKTGKSRAITVVIAPNAKEKAAKGTTGSLANGEYALVAGPRAKGDLLATRILYSMKPIAARRHAVRRPAVFFGQVSNASATGFTLSRTNAKTNKTVSVSVTVGATTHERGLKGLTALANGDYAAVTGKASGKAGARTIAANRVVYSAGKIGPRVVTRHAVRGTVSASSADSITVTNKKGTALTFAITPATKFRVNGQKATANPGFTTGERVGVAFHMVKATKTRTALLIIVPKVASNG